MSPHDALAARPASPAGLVRLFRNLAKLLGGKAVAGLLSLIYLVIVAHQLGAADYGVLMLVNAYAMTVGGIVAFSGFHGVVRYGALRLASGDRDGLARIFRFMTMLELGCGLAAVLVAAIGAPLIGPHLGWSARVVPIAMLFSLAVLDTVRATPQGVLQLADRFDLIGLHQTVSPLVRLFGTLLVWSLGGGLVGYLLVWLVSSVVEGAAMWLLALPSWRRLLDGAPLLGPWRGVLAEHDGLFRFIMATNFDITIRGLAPNLVPLTVGWLLGPAPAGLLALAQRATNLLKQPAALLSNASYAVLAEQVAGGSFAELGRTVWRSTAIAAGSGAAIVMLLALGGDRLAVLLGGHSFARAGMLVVLVGVGFAFALAATPAAAALTALGRPGRSMLVGIVANLGCYPALPLLLVLIGVDGAGWHMLMQNLIAFALLLMFFVHDVKEAA